MEEAKERWGDKIAAVKSGLVKIPGQKPRLIGDAMVSGANSRCVILEKIRLPTLSCVQRVASATPLQFFPNWSTHRSTGRTSMK